MQLLFSLVAFLPPLPPLDEERCLAIRLMIGERVDLLLDVGPLCQLFLQFVDAVLTTLQAGAKIVPVENVTEEPTASPRRRPLGGRRGGRRSPV